uniref:CCHC-type domain-containing protein n=1 Tax=Tanacetum cinerariifolium TaxID=118510 RepID=A0A699GSC9_TANCI|nr:hypothetical protein [Tanacetum cinerariifolium]
MTYVVGPGLYPLTVLPKDIYTLINNYTDAKDIWDNVKMLQEGSELTKEDQESQLNIKMTMSRMQLNSKFVNNMSPEWGRFVTAVKLNRGLRDSNYDQLYAYLKQHGSHANENKMMLDRFSQHIVDPLALMSNVSHQQHYSPSSSTLPSTYVPPNLADNAYLDSIQDGRVVVQNIQGRQNRGLGMNPQGGGTAGYGGVQNRVGNANSGQARQVKCYNCNGTGHRARNYTQPKHQQNSDNYKDKMMLMQAQENRVALDAEQLLFLTGGQDNAIDDDVDEQPTQDLALNVDNVFQADDCDAFDYDVDEALTAQTMFMANLSSADPVTDEAGPSYDSDILSEVQDHDHYQDAVCAHHEEHAMHDNVQLNHVVNSYTDYTSDSNMLLYDQYVKDNAVPVVHSNVSSVPNDAYMMIYNDMFEPYAQSVSNTSQNIVVENSLTTKLATYKEQVELYERRAKFKLTEREQKINEQLRLVISDRNFKEETLKKELHSIKLQLASAINHNKSMVEGVMFLKKDFKQKENKYLEDFLDMKSLKEKVEDRLFKQEQSFQIVHMLCRPKPYYNKLNKGIQKALTKEIKEMKDVFEELETEVAQNVIDRKHDAIKRKNILITNDNIIAECLSKEVFYVATNSKLNVAQFTEMHVANIIVEARCLELEVELSNLHDKSHHDNHEELINHFFKLEHYKDLYDSIKITRAKHIEHVTALTTENVNLKAQLLDKVNSVSKDHVKPKVHAPGKYAINVEPIVPRLRNNREAQLDYLRHLKESIETIRNIVEEDKVVRPLDRSIISACRYTKNSQELLEYTIGTCPQDSHQRDKKHAPAPLSRKK